MNRSSLASMQCPRFVARSAAICKFNVESSLPLRKCSYKQADNSDKALIQAQRAWIGPRDARLETKPIAGQKNKFTVEYQNTGKEPALSFIFDAAPLVFANADEANGVIGKKMTEYLLKCNNTPARMLAGVVFPTSGFSISQLTIPIDETLIDE